jgi:hypothetical protein
MKLSFSASVISAIFGFFIPFIACDRGSSSAFVTRVESRSPLLLLLGFFFLDA